MLQALEFSLSIVKNSRGHDYLEDTTRAIGLLLYP